MGSPPDNQNRELRAIGRLGRQKKKVTSFYGEVNPKFILILPSIPLMRCSTFFPVLSKTDNTCSILSSRVVFK
jgi:hypothetical protein